MRGNVIGVVQTHKTGDFTGWTDEEKFMLETIIEQLGVALESARLYEETQRRAVQEQLTGEVAASFRESLDIETVLQTAARELRNALNLAEVEISHGSISNETRQKNQ